MEIPARVISKNDGMALQNRAATGNDSKSFITFSLLIIKKLTNVDCLYSHGKKTKLLSSDLRNASDWAFCHIDIRRVHSRFRNSLQHLIAFEDF